MSDEVEELVVEELVVLVRKSGELVEKLERKVEESRREVECTVLFG